MLRSSDSLTPENPLNAFEREEILQALAIAGLLSQEKVYLELTNEAVNFARKENFSFSQLCALVSVTNRVLKELSNYDSEIVDLKPSGTDLLYSILKYALDDQIEGIKQENQISD